MKNIGSQSFDQKLKNFFFFHWEKLVVALAAGGVVLFFMWGRSKSFDESTPAELHQMAQQAEQYVNASDSWQQISSFRQGNLEAAEKIDSERTIDESLYPIGNFIGTKIVTRGLRKDPDIKAPLDPQATALVSSMLIVRPRNAQGDPIPDYWAVFLEKQTDRVDPNAGQEDEMQGLAGRFRQQVNEDPEEDGTRTVVLTDLQSEELLGVVPSRLGLSTDVHTTKVVSAVAVTALFPHELEVQEYKNCFQDAIGFFELRDQPRYVRLQVERQKSVGGEEQPWEDITRFVTQTLPKEVYAAHGPEIVEEEYVDKNLTMPIPPFVYTDLFQFAKKDAVPVLKVEEKIEAETGGVIPQMIELDMFRKKDPANDPAEADASAAETAKVKIPKYKLIRFFDMGGVQPGETVRYRIRVWLADPNNITDPRVLETLGATAEQVAAAAGTDSEAGLGAGGGGKGSGGNQSTGNTAAADLMKLEWTYFDTEVRNRLRELEGQTFTEEWMKFCRVSPWSPETNWVTVPAPTPELVAGRVEYPGSTAVNGVEFVDAEPSVSVVTKKWDPALQIPVAAEQKAPRATVLNFRTNANVLNPINRTIYEVKRDLMAGGEAETGVNFNTGLFVVDILGGWKMPFSTAEKSYTYPAEVLVMSESGEMMVRNEIQDREEYRHNTFAGDEKISDVEPRRTAEPGSNDEENFGRNRGRGR